MSNVVYVEANFYKIFVYDSNYIVILRRQLLTQNADYEKIYFFFYLHFFAFATGNASNFYFSNFI